MPRRSNAEGIEACMQAQGYHAWGDAAAQRSECIKYVRSKKRVRDGAHANFLREAFYGATARGHRVSRLN